MKVLKRVIFGIIIGIVVILAFVIVMGELIEHGILKSSEDEEPQITIEYEAQNYPSQIDEETIPDADYYDSVEEALQNNSVNGKNKDADTRYQNNIDEVIKKFENDNYIALYFRSVKDENTECITFAKFKKKEIDNRVKYTFIASIPLETERDDFFVGTLESLIEGQLSLSDYMQDVNIDPENTRFVYGDCHSKKIYQLKVEGQKPSEIIPYEMFGKIRYFWYYENLESDIAGSQLSFTLE